MLKVPIQITLDKLSTIDRELQFQFMRNWFYENYEDPVHRTPFSSEEGGYIWVIGGPYDARQELESQFGDYVSSDVINDLASELEGESTLWAPVPQSDDFESYIVEDIQSIEDVSKEFNRAINDIQVLLATNISAEVRTRYNALLFSNVITALESYLSGKFIQLVLNDKERFRRFVETTPDFTHEKFNLSEIFKVSDELTEKVGKFLADLLWHNLGRIKPMYKTTLGIDLGDIGTLMKAGKKRHDLVHRSGRSKEGMIIKIEAIDIESLIAEVKLLINRVESHFELPF